MILISQADLHRIESHLGQCLDRLLVAPRATPAQLQPLIDCVRRYVMQGGKRVRPQLCAWAFLNLGETNLTEEVLDVSCAWEIFHAFLLVHDDLIDVADTRRKIPSLHRQLQLLDHDSPQFGQNLAIVAGDLLFSASIRLLAEINMDAGRQVQLIQLFSRIACTTGLGQAIDLFQSQLPLAGVCEDTLLCEYDWKTAAYTFEGPLLSGAILAGADGRLQAVLSRVSQAIGQAYQLHNDLQDLSQPAHEGCDLVQGKRTVTLMRARAGMSVEDRLIFDRELEAIPSANGQAVPRAERLRTHLNNSGAVQQTRALIDRLLEEAATAARSIEGVAQGGGALSALVESLQRHYFSAAMTVSASLDRPVMLETL